MILSNLKLIYFSDIKSGHNFIEIISKLPQGSFFIYRQYQLDYNQRFKEANILIKYAIKYKIKFIIAKDIKLAQKVKAHGVHFSDKDNIKSHDLILTKKDKNFIISMAAHNIKTILKLKNYQIDLLFIAPIFKTSSHPCQNNLGKIELIKILKIYKNILPLGGINKKNINFIIKNKIIGFGAIDYFTPIILCN
jgi:thiamine monophosphate synthase